MATVLPTHRHGPRIIRACDDNGQAAADLLSRNPPVRIDRTIPGLSMSIHHVEVPNYPAPHSPYSHAVVANGFVFVSGQIPVRPGGRPMEIAGETMQEQTRQALRNVETILKAAGSSLDRVVKITVLLARPELYREMNEAYAGFFPDAKPARTMARFGADIPGVLVAIDAIALASGV
jgi:2-iminobutanoate/2-iminopropanoate deaminase